jgi:predicted RND superfamily exporter protein
VIERLLTVGRTGRLVSLVVLVTVSVAAALQLDAFKIDRSDDRLISKTDPGWTHFHQMQADFGAEESVLVYLRARDLWTTERLKELQQVTFDLEDTPGITSVSSLLSATNIRDKGEFVDAGPLMALVPDSAERLAELRDDALYSPIMRRTFISSDGLATMISIGYEDDPDDPEHELHVFELIENGVAPLRKNFEVVFQLGRPRLNVEIDTGLFQDLRRLIPLSVAILVVIITLFLKSGRIVPVPLVTSGISLLWTFGFMAVAGIPLTLLTAMIPALVVVVGSVEDVHLLAAYLDGLKPGNGGARARAIEHMAKHVGLPILITSLTTATGFIANVVTEIPLIFEFAIASAFAMVANLIVTALSVPLLLHWCGPRVNPLQRDKGVPGGVIGAVVRIVESASEKHPGMIIVGTIAVLAWFGSNIPNVRVNNDPLSYFPTEHPFVSDANTVHEDLAGLHVFSVTLKSAVPGLFETSEWIKKIAAVQKLLDRQGLFDKTQSLADLMSLMHQEMHQGDKAYFDVPDLADEVDLYLSSFTRDDLEPFVTEDYTTARISVRHNLTNSVLVNQTIDDISARLPTILGPDIDYALTGKNLMVNRAAESLMKGQISSLLLILFIIFVLFSVLYTSWLAGLLSLVPNVIPIVLNFGLMGFLGVPLNPGTAMVAAIAIGVAVDDTIHLMARFGAESKLHLDERDAVRASIRGESVPIISTSVALALGFAALALSQFSIVAQFGLLAAATMIYAAVADLLIMPILLRHLRLATVWDIVALQLDRNVLVNCTLFRNMSQFAIKKVVVLSDIQDFKAEDVIIEQGSISSGMYVVLEGEAEVKVRRDNIELYIDDIGPGGIFGEIGFSGEGVERSATITGRGPVSVVRLDAESMQKGLRFYPRIAARLHQNISNILAARLIESHDRLADTVRIHLG